MGSSTNLKGGLMQSYYLYAAVLALKLLAFVPLASIMCNPDKVQRANLSDLKHLTPFWLVAALYVTTSPDYTTAVNLMRAFVAARMVVAAGYITKIPKMAVEASFFMSFAITTFMAGWVINEYKSSL